jgi:hypothetical protein
MSDPPPGLARPPEGYAGWLADLKTRIHAAQQRATLAVNRELVSLYLSDRARDTGPPGGTGLGRPGHRPAGS